VRIHLGEDRQGWILSAATMACIPSILAGGQLHLMDALALGERIFVDLWGCVGMETDA
jgi:hypothetical protein